MPNKTRRKSMDTQEQVSESQKRKNNAQQQTYDNLFKRMIEGQFEEIVPLLFSALDPKILRELNIEALLPPRRMDRVYLSKTAKGKVIFHIEVEMSPRGRKAISRRLLIYHSLLIEKYNTEEGEEIIVITLVVYPFDIPGGEPVLIEKYGGEKILYFCYRELSLRAIDAPTFVQARPIPLYGWLPAMGGVSLELLMNAIEDMIKYYHGDDDSLRDELLCFLALLNRAKPLPNDEMEQVLRRISMHDPLLEEDPWVQEYAAKREAKAEAKGRAKEKIKNMRESVKTVVETRFPLLCKLAMERVEQMEDPDELKGVLIAMSAATSEPDARQYLLDLPVAKNQEASHA